MSAQNGVQNGAPDIVIDVHGLTKTFDGRRWCATCRCRSSAARFTASSGRTAPARPRPSACCAACSRPTKASGTCLGYDIRTEADKIKRQVGYMTQHFSLYEDLSVRENLEFVARIYGIAKPALRRAQRSSGSGLPAARSRSRANFPAAGSSGSRSAPARCRARNCCCSTSRPPASIPRRGANSGTRSTRSPPTGSPCWSPPITWTRPSAATRSLTSLTARCWRAAPWRM